jgi:hypothetical protein
VKRSAAERKASVTPGIRPSASAAAASNAAGTNITTGVFSGPPFSSGSVSSSVARGRSPAGPQPKKTRAITRRTAPAVSAEVAISTATTAP